jgi:hypothetical protein
MPAPSGPPAAPVVPGYVLEQLLGRGGSGQVWRARPRNGGPPVAVKVLVRGDAGRQEREAALLGELDHPHLVRLHEVVRREVRGGQAEVTLVLDLLAGGSLAALLARRGRLRPGEVVTTVAPVAAALAHAHDRGIVHGDLSPGNVVFTAEGRPVLTDLGTARLVGDQARAEVTPAYVDPVVARGGAPGPASDVFGVAAAAFHALTGIAPWNAADPRGTLAVAAEGELPDLGLLAPEAPEELIRVVQRGLSPEPHRRGSAAAFALDLRHACAPEPVRLPVAGVPDLAQGAAGSIRHTELTHQVPGRARAAHAAPAPDGRRARLRAGLAERLGMGVEHDVRALTGRVLHRTAVVAGVLVAVVAGLSGAAWVGASWGGGSGRPVPAAETTEQGPEAGRTPAELPADETTSTAPPATGGGPEAEPTTSGAPAVDRTVAPADDAGWTAVLAELYARRAAAFNTGDATVLAEVYLPGSALLDRDTAALQALHDSGRTLSDFTPQVRRLEQVTTDADGRVQLRLVDELPGYRVVPRGSDGSAAVEVPSRGAAEVRLVLQQTSAGWRISDARVEP